MKLKARNPKEFAKEIHSSNIQAKVTSFNQLEKLTEDWIVNYTNEACKLMKAKGGLQAMNSLEKALKSNKNQTFDITQKS
ncbi:MAG: hypothetical protein JXR60_06040 [Bacteroidales bacterium]|nr:hypothetical protein [Bacteroidales bacterium]